MKFGNQEEHNKITKKVALMKKLYHPNAIKLHDVMYCSELSTWYMGKKLSMRRMHEPGPNMTLSVRPVITCLVIWSIAF